LEEISKIPSQISLLKEDGGGCSNLSLTTPMYHILTPKLPFHSLFFSLPIHDNEN